MRAVGAQVPLSCSDRLTRATQLGKDGMRPSHPREVQAGSCGQALWVWVAGSQVRVAAAGDRLTTSLDNSANPIGGTGSHASMKMRFAKPAAMRSICLRSPASRAASRGSLVPAASTLLLSTQA